MPLANKMLYYLMWHYWIIRIFLLQAYTHRKFRPHIDNGKDLGSPQMTLNAHKRCHLRKRFTYDPIRKLSRDWERQGRWQLGDAHPCDVPATSHWCAGRRHLIRHLFWMRRNHEVLNWLQLEQSCQRFAVEEVNSMHLHRSRCTHYASTLRKGEYSWKIFPTVVILQFLIWTSVGGVIKWNRLQY